MYTKLFKAATLPSNLSAKYVPLFLLANAVEFLKQILCYRNVTTQLLLNLDKISDLVIILSFCWNSEI